VTHTVHLHDQYEREGYLLLRGLLNPEMDLEPIVREYEGILERLIDTLYAAGKISSRYVDLPFGERVMQIQVETGTGLVQHFECALPRINITNESPMWVGEAVFNALRNPRLLDAIEPLMGSEIFVSPIHHVRMKIPDHMVQKSLGSDYQVVRTPWHQDAAAVTEEADNTNMITVWFSLWDVPISSGPLQIIPGSHRRGLLTHCPVLGSALAIPDRLLEQALALSLPVKRGDVLILNKFTVHSSMPNHSDTIRWSFDLRYVPVGQPTGREIFPGFVARSRKAPNSELHDARAWARSWFQTRERLSKTPPSKPFNRWQADAPPCA